MTRRPAPRGRLGSYPLSTRGLDHAEVEDRRRVYGANDVVEAAASPWVDLARNTAKDPMLWFLLATAVLYVALGQRLEATTLLVAIVPLVAMDAFLHRRTQASTEGLRGRLAADATVVRAGSRGRIRALDLVPGDLLAVGPGETFGADGIVVAGQGLHAEEAVLTGEAFPVTKRPLTAQPEGAEPFVEIHHWVFAGTRLLTGEALVRVVFTGAQTLYGEIARSAVTGGRTRTPLQEAIGRLVNVLVVVAGAMCALIAVVRLRQGFGMVDAVVSAVTLAAAALPEEFPVALTVFLGVGVYRLARRQALVRRAMSVENIGRVSCIFSDKTGTITDGRLRLTHSIPADGTSGARLLGLAARASRAGHGDPLDEVILREATLAGEVISAAPVATFPFTEGRKRETAIVREADGRMVAVTKGAAELLLTMSRLGEDERAAWQSRVDDLAADGHRVIACAWRPLEDPDGTEPDADYTFAGLLALEDPIRDGVADAVRACRAAGIHTIMVTGDHPATAAAVAREIGLGAGKPVVISGEEALARAAASPRTLRSVDVIARAVPAQKLALVRALQSIGEVVAVTGDGVNDVPALQAADVGIAMGERGTRSAREAAAIVLLDDDFGTIVRAVNEGRQLFENLRSSFAYLLIVHAALVSTAAFVPLAGYPLLYLPVHLVWVEAIIHPSALLVFQDVSDGTRPARAHRGAPRFFARREWAIIGAAGALLSIFVALGYVRSVDAASSVEHGRAMALVVLTFGSAAVTAGLTRLGTRVSRVVAGATIAFSIVLTQTPVVARALHLAPLHGDDWGLAVAAAATVGIVAALFRPSPCATLATA